jgi:hypothetical protein
MIKKTSFKKAKEGLGGLGRGGEGVKPALERGFEFLMPAKHLFLVVGMVQTRRAGPIHVGGGSGSGDGLCLFFKGHRKGKMF